MRLGLRVLDCLEPVGQAPPGVSSRGGRAGGRRGLFAADGEDGGGRENCDDKLALHAPEV